MLRCSTARGSGTRHVPVGPTKVKARKSILFMEGTPEVEINERQSPFPSRPKRGGSKARKPKKREKGIDKKAAFIAERSRALLLLNCGRGGSKFKSQLGTFFSEFVFRELDGELS